MSESPAYAIEDFQDLPFDVSRHTEAFKSFAALNLASLSIKPALCARDLVFIRVPSCVFRFGVTNNPSAQEATESGNGSIAFQTLHQARNAEEAKYVRDEVELYFLRHYPGRTLGRMSEANTQAMEGNFVYITCYAPSA